MELFYLPLIVCALMSRLSLSITDNEILFHELMGFDITQLHFFWFSFDLVILQL